MSLALIIFLLAFLAEIISWIGSTVLLNIVYTIYQYLFHSSDVRKHKDLKRQVLIIKQELLQTSAQDQFAKWAKLRRKVDKGLEDLEKTNNEMAHRKTSFSVGFKTIIWVITTGSQWGIGWWYGRQAVFYLPPQWFGPATWCLSLPFAPLGSVSVGVWQMVCRRVLRVLEGVVKEFIGPSVKPDPTGTPSAETGTEQKKEL